MRRVMGKARPPISSCVRIPEHLYENTPVFFNTGAVSHQFSVGLMYHSD